MSRNRTATHGTRIDRDPLRAPTRPTFNRFNLEFIMSVNKPLTTIAAIAALSLLGAGSAMAAGEFLDAPAPAMSTLSRAAVQAEVLAARSAGTLGAAGQGLAADKPLALAPTGLDRAAVRAAVLAARAAGTLGTAGEGLASYTPVVDTRRSAQAGTDKAWSGGAVHQ